MALVNILCKHRPFKFNEIKNISILSGNLRYSSSKSTTGVDTPKPEKVKTEKPSPSPSPSKTSAKASSTQSSAQPVKLSYSSAATPKPPNEPVGPGASKTGDYKNPEYYSYNEISYFDLELEMMKDRLPQPKSGNEMY